MPDFVAPKGIPEYYPPVSRTFEAIRRTLLAAADRAGYGPIELPVFEDTGLFARGVGESTDVVSKEMYTFADRGDRSVTLRPACSCARSLASSSGLHCPRSSIKRWLPST